MIVELLDVGDWQVVMIDGERREEGHRFTAADMAEFIADALSDKKKYPAGIGEFKFIHTRKEEWQGKGDKIEEYVDQVARRWKAKKSLRHFPSEWSTALYALAHGKEVEWNSYPYGILEMSDVIQTVSYHRYTLTQLGKDIVEYLDEIQAERSK